MAKQNILVVGAGFGGIKAALELVDDERFNVTLLSPNVNFRYYPTLYHVATGGRRDNASIPLDYIFKGKAITLVQGEAASLDRSTKTLTLKDGRHYAYDSIILGLGVVTNFFGIPGMQERSFSIKSIDEIARFKQHVHEELTAGRKLSPHYVIVGAGPTGIELAGALPGYIRKVMERHGIRHHAVHVDLIEASPRLLPRMPKDMSAAIHKRLKRLGVRIYTGKTVQGLAADELTVSGKPIRSHTVVWTAGVTNHPFFKDNGFMMAARGKVATDMYLQADTDVYVIGDNANTPYSGMAQTALHDGIYVAESLRRKADGDDPKGYPVKKPITVIPVGEYWAAVLWGTTKLYGPVGWLLREAGDYVGFKDYEPWWKAGRQWLTGFGEEETCPVCLQSGDPHFIAAPAQRA